MTEVTGTGYWPDEVDKIVPFNSKRISASGLLTGGWHGNTILCPSVPFKCKSSRLWNLFNTEKRKELM